jgi:hypothetical protein
VVYYKGNKANDFWEAASRACHQLGYSAEEIGRFRDVERNATAGLKEWLWEQGIRTDNRRVKDKSPESFGEDAASRLIDKASFEGAIRTMLASLAVERGSMSLQDPEEY